MYIKVIKINKKYIYIYTFYIQYINRIIMYIYIYILEISVHINETFLLVSYIII
jgi:hypothetical protein